MKNHTFHTQPFPRRFNQLTRIEQQSEIFHNARLVCRETHILKHDIEGKFYQGEVRLLYRTEGDFRSRPFDGEELGSSRKSSILVDVEEQTEQGQSRTPSMVFKMPPIDFGDFFCCAGGATQGATQAGLNPKFAADKDNLALAVYALNHPGAKIYLMDAHDIQYIDEATERCMKVEILHLSPPCRYWSPLQ
jgi:DNA (cytosine-5)-methyltransferase 1